MKKYYHWLIVVLILLQLTVHGGTNNNLSLFFLPVSEDFGVSRSAFSISTSLTAVACMTGTFLSGAILLRFGYRKSVFFFLLMGLCGMCILSASNNMIAYCVGCVTWGLTLGVSCSAGPPRLVGAWFHRRQGTVLGVVTAATGLGGSLMCLLLSMIIEKIGWKSAFLTAALLMGILALAIVVLVRDRPEEKGLKPFGQGQWEAHKKESDDHWIGYTFSELVRAPAFYLTLLSTFTSCFFSGGMLTIVIPHLQDAGLSPSRAASMQSTMMLALAAVKFGCGFFSDKIGAKYVAMVCLASTAISAALFPFAGNTAIALITVLILSVSLPLTSVMIPLLCSALFGYQTQASCLSIVMGIASFANILSTPVANVLFDKLGSYVPFFQICAVGSAVLMLLYPVIYRLTDKDKARILAQNGNA